MPLLLQTRHSVALNKFPLCHPTAARREEAVEGQLFPAGLQECVCAGHAQDCSLPPPSTHSEQLWGPEGCSYEVTSMHPLPRLHRAPRHLQGKKLRRANKLLPAGDKASACLRPRPP